MSCEIWVARKVAALSRGLDQVQVRVVDDAVADAIAAESPSRASLGSRASAPSCSTRYAASSAERTHLRTIGKVFPHATRISRSVDMDHPKQWDAHGTPGQTGDHNAAPLGRTHHRAKTHLGYRLRQLWPGE